MLDYTDIKRNNYGKCFGCNSFKCFGNNIRFRIGLYLFIYIMFIISLMDRGDI